MFHGFIKSIKEFNYLWFVPNGSDYWVKGDNSKGYSVGVNISNTDISEYKISMMVDREDRVFTKIVSFLDGRYLLLNMLKVLGVSLKSDIVVIKMKDGSYLNIPCGECKDKNIYHSLSLAVTTFSDDGVRNISVIVQDEEEYLEIPLDDFYLIMSSDEESKVFFREYGEMVVRKFVGECYSSLLINGYEMELDSYTMPYLVGVSARNGYTNSKIVYNSLIFDLRSWYLGFMLVSEEVGIHIGVTFDLLGKVFGVFEDGFNRTVNVEYINRETIDKKKSEGWYVVDVFSYEGNRGG